MPWHSERFGLLVRPTRHAEARMAERLVEVDLLADLIETGTIKRKDTRRLWIFKHYEVRKDNLLCAAVTIESELVVKTVMTYWRESDP